MTFKNIQKLRKFILSICLKLRKRKTRPTIKRESPSMVLKVRQDSRQMEHDIATMKKRIDFLECERLRLHWALATLEHEPPVEESTLNLTPPPPMTPIKDSPVKRLKTSSIDSAYESADSSLRSSPVKLPVPTFDKGRFMSNGYNTYYLAV